MSKKASENKPTQDALLKPDPGRYREMSAPFPSRAEAEAAIDAFTKDVAEARLRHRIKDVVVIYLFDHLTADGDEVGMEGRFSMGDSQRVLPMLAVAFGSERERFNVAIHKALSRG